VGAALRALGGCQLVPPVLADQLPAAASGAWAQEVDRLHDGSPIWARDLRERRTVATVNWFMDTAMDGVVGGIIGGGATGVAVLFTLRHESKQARGTELRTAIARLHAAVIEELRIPRRGRRRMKLRQDFGYRLIADLQVILAIAGDDKTGLADDLFRITSDLIRSRGTDGVLDEDMLSGLLQELEVRLHMWLVDPKTYKDEFTDLPPGWSLAQLLAASEMAQRAVTEDPALRDP
jgi:hypothetical protein